MHRKVCKPIWGLSSGTRRPGRGPWLWGVWGREEMAPTQRLPGLDRRKGDAVNRFRCCQGPARAQPAPGAGGGGRVHTGSVPERPRCHLGRAQLCGPCRARTLGERSCSGRAGRVARGCGWRQGPLSERCWLLGARDGRTAQDQRKPNHGIRWRIFKGSRTEGESVGNQFRLLLPAAVAARALQLEPCGSAVGSRLVRTHCARRRGGDVRLRRRLLEKRFGSGYWRQLPPGLKRGVQAHSLNLLN